MSDVTETTCEKIWASILHASPLELHSTTRQYALNTTTLRAERPTASGKRTRSRMKKTSGRMETVLAEVSETKEAPRQTRTRKAAG